MSDIKLTERLTNMLTDNGATALLTIITATHAINTSGRPINEWDIDWQTGDVFTIDQFRVGTDGASPPKISIDVRATIPADMILARQSREHQVLCLHQGEVWSIEDLACYDLRTFQVLEWRCSMDTYHRVRNRMRTEWPERFQAFATAPNPFWTRKG